MSDLMTKPSAASGPATAGPGAGAARRRRRRHDPTARGVWPFALPAVLVTAVLVLVPVAYAIWLSVSDRQADGTNSGFLGFANYADMFGNPEFWNSLKITLFLFVVCLLVETVLGLALGYVMSLDVPGRRIFQGMMLIPAITASVAVGLVWLLIMDPTLGAANQLLGKVGIDPVVWLGDPDIAPWSIALVDIWQWTPFMALIIAAGIRSLPEEPFEAAAIDGASGWRTAWNIGLPLLRPVLTVAMLLRTVDLVRFFDTIYIMTQGGPVNSTNTLNVYGYNAGFVDQEPSYAAALQIALLALVVVIAGAFTWFRQRASQ
ncbi:sugar ABC transporter permease [Micromonospora sp. WMMD1128]|uniref:carbohydrate ABC transporter permease n=1 Tax=Micromonospora sp. WMMD1128 TaxID=3015150 RepID=UPI00248B0F3F|nr:sugar ABC transporter permease [Micromonospora sp. WMMD1128]WBB76019.1 sugar ABC transporter permease [Micromonospora sp. WMMD1128]